VIKFSAQSSTYTLGKRTVALGMLSNEAKAFLERLAKHRFVQGDLDFSAPYSSPQYAFYGIRDTAGEAFSVDQIFEALGERYVVKTALMVAFPEKWVSAATVHESFPHAFAYKLLHSKYVPTITNLDIGIVGKIGSISIRFVVSRKKGRNLNLKHR
jgi:hypothetical protein